MRTTLLVAGVLLACAAAAALTLARRGDPPDIQTRGFAVVDVQPIRIDDFYGPYYAFARPVPDQPGRYLVAHFGVMYEQGMFVKWQSLPEALRLLPGDPVVRGSLTCSPLYEVDIAAHSAKIVPWSTWVAPTEPIIDPGDSRLLSGRESADEAPRERPRAADRAHYRVGNRVFRAAAALADGLDAWPDLPYCLVRSATGPPIITPANRFSDEQYRVAGERYCEWFDTRTQDFHGPAYRIVGSGEADVLGFFTLDGKHYMYYSEKALWFVPVPPALAKPAQPSTDVQPKEPSPP